MAMMQKPTVAKQRTNVTLDADNLAAARELGLNVSAISDAALDAEVRKARAEAWAAENAETLRARARRIREQGTTLSKLQILQID